MHGLVFEENQEYFAGRRVFFDGAAVLALSLAGFSGNHAAIEFR
jgi:hypothetical protein